MQLPHNAAVLVADGRKMLFLRNEGDADYPNLVVESGEERADGGGSTDRAGQAASTQRGGAGFAPSRGTLGEADYHQIEEDRFAAEAADLLKRRALANGFDKLVVIAPPRALGELRKHYHAAVSERLVGELDKDLTGHPIADIEKAIAAA